MQQKNIPTTGFSPQSLYGNGGVGGWVVSSQSRPLRQEQSPINHLDCKCQPLKERRAGWDRCVIEWGVGIYSLLVAIRVFPYLPPPFFLLLPWLVSHFPLCSVITPAELKMSPSWAMVTAVTLVSGALWSPLQGVKLRVHCGDRACPF